MKHLARILFFVAGVAPSAKDYAAAEKLGANVSFRNANAVPAEGALEQCDGVAGAVPARYAEAYPTAAEALEIKSREQKELAEIHGDTPAPTRAQKGFGEATGTSDPGNPDAALNEANGPTAVGGPKPNPAGQNAPASPGTAAAPRAWGSAPADAAAKTPKR